jgi:hypothetical protein
MIFAGKSLYAREVAIINTHPLAGAIGSELLIEKRTPENRKRDFATGFFSPKSWFYRMVPKTLRN